MTLINQNSIIGVTSITSTASSDVITFHTSDTTERLRIDTSGNATFGGNVSVAGVLTYEDVTSVDAVGLSTFQNGIHVTGGDVGIGTDDPTNGTSANARQLVIRNTADPTSRGGLSLIHGTSGTGGFGSIYFGSSNATLRGYIEYAHQTDSMQFGTLAGERLRITSGGRVGLGSDGVSSPQSVLHVFSNSSTDTIKIQAPTSSGDYDAGFEVLRDTTAGGAKMVAKRNTASGGVGWEWFTTANNTAEVNATYTSRMVLTESGTVGIGTDNPDRLLHLGSTGAPVIKISDYDTGVPAPSYAEMSFNGGNMVFSADAGDVSGSTRVAFEIDGDEKVRITSAGNVGIATDNPATLLDVRDTITQSDNVGFVRILNDTVSTGSASNTSLIVQNNNVRCQFFAWEASGIRMGVRNKLNNGSGNVYITAGNDTVRLTIDAATGNFTGSASADISDGRLKENIQNISATDAVNIIKGLQGRTFTWKAEANMGTDTKYGFIAQEVESILPNLVHQNNGINRVSKDVDKQGYGQGEIIDDYSDSYKDDTQSEWSKSVEKTGIIPILVEALKDSIAKIETLESEVASLKAAQ